MGSSFRPSAFHSMNTTENLTLELALSCRKADVVQALKDDSTIKTEGPKMDLHNAM